MNKQQYFEILKAIERNEINSNSLQLGIDPFLQVKESEKLNDNDILLLVDSLKQNSHIRKLDLTGNNIGYLGAMALTNLTTIDELNLSYNNIGPIGAKILAEGSFKKLSLYANPIKYTTNRDEQFLKMTDSFMKNKSIEDLNLTHCVIPDKMLANIIKNNDKIKILCTTDELGDLALEFLDENKSIHTLCIPENKLTDLSVKYILKNSTLKVLTIDSSKIGDEGIKHLSTHQNLIKLAIKDSNITSTGLQYFFTSNISEVNIYNSQPNNSLSSFDIWKFNNDFRIFSEEKKIVIQQNYYNQINKHNYNDINPNMNNFDSIQEAINILQYRESKDSYFD